MKKSKVVCAIVVVKMDDCGDQIIDEADVSIHVSLQLHAKQIQTTMIEGVS